MTHCPNCGKNLALVGRVHRCIPVAKRTAFEKIAEGLNEALAIASGEANPAKALGAKGGKSKSPAKQAASRANGKRPKRKPSA